MSLPYLNGTCTLLEEPDLTYSMNSKKPTVTLHLGFFSKKRDRSGGWVDGDSFFVEAKVFGQNAERAAGELEKGDECIVSGRLKTDKHTDPVTKVITLKTVLFVDAIGVDVKSWATPEEEGATA
jgi:single-strand DNA-binding protein